jgi:hypothetical protein
VVKNGQREEHGGTVLPQSSTVWLFKPAAKVAEQEDSRVLLPRENAPEIIDLWQENAYACPGECPLHQRLCSVKLRWRVLGLECITARKAMHGTERCSAKPSRL